MNPPKDEQKSFYSTGGCDVFAIALQELTGGDIMTVSSTVGELGDADDAAVDLDTPVLLHCWVLTPDGVAIDSNGRHEEATMAEEWGKSNEVKALTAAELQAIFGSFPGPLSLARHFVKKYSAYYIGKH